MVAVFEIVFLILFVLIGIWWFRRTSLYRARRGDPNFRPDGTKSQYFNHDSSASGGGGDGGGG